MSDTRRETLAFVAVFALLEAALLAPLCVSRYLPIVDWPEHLASVAIARRLADGSAADLARYTTDLFPNTNGAFLALTAPIAGWTGPDVAGRIAVALYLLAFPVAIALLGREASGGGIPWPALLAFRSRGTRACSSGS